MLRRVLFNAMIKLAQTIKFFNVSNVFLVIDLYRITIFLLKVATKIPSEYAKYASYMLNANNNSNNV